LIAGDIDNFEFTDLMTKNLGSRSPARKAPLLRETFLSTRQRNERAGSFAPLSALGTPSRLDPVAPLLQLSILNDQHSTFGRCLLALFKGRDNGLKAHWGAQATSLCSAVRVILEHRHSCLCAKQALLPVSSPRTQQVKSSSNAQAYFPAAATSDHGYRKFQKK